MTQDIYFLPIEINDNGIPLMSSTNTLTIRVCSCDSKDTILSCNVEPYVLPAGLSTGALIAILACIVILLGKPACGQFDPGPERRLNSLRSSFHLWNRIVTLVMNSDTIIFACIKSLVVTAQAWQGSNGSIRPWDLNQRP